MAQDEETPDVGPELDPQESSDEAGELEVATEEEAPSEPIWCWGTGRRKTSVARVRVRPGAGEVQVNKRPFREYFSILRLQGKALLPLDTAQMRGRVDVFVNLSGGGTTGQAEAMLMGLARALVKLEPKSEEALRKAGYLTRDSRMVERKKYGRRGARRRFQYSKR